MSEKQRRNGRLEGMQEIFFPAVKQLKIGKSFSNHLVLFYWPRIVGEGIANHVKPVKLEYKRLFLRSVHPAWADQLRYMEQDIITKINAYMGEYLVNELVFTGLTNQIEPVSEPTAGLAYEDISRAVQQVALSQQELDDLQQAGSVCQNPDLQSKLLQVGQNLLKLRKYRLAHGWHPCAQEGCQQLAGKGEIYCLSCERGNREKRAAKIRQALYDAPWATYGEFIKDFPCTANELNAQRTILLQQLAGRISSDDRESTDVKTLVMLYRSLPPESLTPEVIDKTMKRLRFDVRFKPKAVQARAGRLAAGRQELYYLEEN